MGDRYLALGYGRVHSLDMPPGQAITQRRAKIRTGSMAENIARRVAETTIDGTELVDFALRVFRDPTMPFEDRRWAMEWLADRGAGKAHAVIDVQTTNTTTVRMDLTDYTFEELEAWEAMQRAAEARKQLQQTKVIDVLPESVKP
jgi:hypothetical protein